MRIFKRLFPFVALVLLFGVAWARPAAPITANRQFLSSIHQPPSPPELDFGTVVRDTADEQNVDAGHGPMECILHGRAPTGLPAWVLFLAPSWFTLVSR